MAAMRTTGIVLLLLLVGCGDGGSTPFDDFFGGGLSPGSSLDEVQPGGVAGRILVRADDRIVVRPSDAALAGGTPVAGAVVHLVGHGERTTAGDGLYAFAEVPAGNYQLTIRLPAGLGGRTDTFAIRVAPGQVTAGLPTGD